MENNHGLNLRTFGKSIKFEWCIFLDLPFPTETIKEGAAHLLIPDLSLYARGESEYIPRLAPVFYNPKMRLNRDLAVLALKVLKQETDHPLRVADPLAGCGVRAIRFALEIDGLNKIQVNDLNPLAIDLARKNAVNNSVRDLLEISNLDCNLFLNIHSFSKNRFDYIDLDPYGSPSRFIESAIRAINNKGLLAITATDTAPLCGVEPRACLRKYMGIPLRSEYCHEIGLRLLVRSIVLSAARYDLSLRVLLSHSSDHYFRAYVWIERGAERADKTVGNLGYILHCFHCLNRVWTLDSSLNINNTCHRCGKRMRVAGPLWLGSLIEKQFVHSVLSKATAVSNLDVRVVPLLRNLEAEALMPPTYYVIDTICDKLDSVIPPRNLVMKELSKCGYRVTRTHFKSNALKTDASIIDVEAAIIRARR